ncbi:MAG: DNRLRE domain-containing protein [Phycisphaerales bacterium]
MRSDSTAASTPRRPLGVMAGLLAGVAGAGVLASPVAAADEVVALAATADTTIYEPGDLSNGSGRVIFAGRNGNGGGAIRQRALIRFDLSAVPAGAVITAVEFELTLEQASGGSGSQTVELRRAIGAWGEGASATMSGAGAPAQPGDATWTERVRPGQLWDTPGGDAAPAPSAALAVGPVAGPWTWSGAGLVDDVQAWVDGAAVNDGWLVIGGEASPSTSRRFASRESTNAATVPQLRVHYSVASCPGDLDDSGTVGIGDLISVLAAWGPCKGCPADLDGSGAVDLSDLISLLAAWGPCP